MDISQILNLVGVASEGMSQGNGNTAETIGETADSVLGAAVPVYGAVESIVEPLAGMISGPTNQYGTYDSNISAGVQGFTGIDSVLGSWSSKDLSTGEKVISTLVPWLGEAWRNDRANTKIDKKNYEITAQRETNRQSNFENNAQRQGYTDYAKNIYSAAMGGQLPGTNPLNTANPAVAVEGLKHEQGGVTTQVPTERKQGVELEGGEVKWGNFVFSDRIPYKK